MSLWSRLSDWIVRNFISGSSAPLVHPVVQSPIHPDGDNRDDIRDHQASERGDTAGASRDAGAMSLHVCIDGWLCICIDGVSSDSLSSVFRELRCLASVRQAERL